VSDTGKNVFFSICPVEALKTPPPPPFGASRKPGIDDHPQPKLPVSDALNLKRSEELKGNKKGGNMGSLPVNFEFGTAF